MDADVPTDERHVRVRPSRVVLARPSRRQVGDDASRIAAMTVATKLVHRGEREVSRKPLRREGRRDPPPPAVVALSRNFFARGLRVSGGHPVFPAPSVYFGGSR